MAMDFKYIEQLLERYWQCDTSLEEEAQLRAFFSRSDVPAHLLRYKDLFVYQQLQQEAGLDEDFDARVLAEVEPPVVKPKACGSGTGALIGQCDAALFLQRSERSGRGRYDRKTDNRPFGGSFQRHDGHPRTAGSGRHSSADRPEGGTGTMTFSFALNINIVSMLY